MRGRRRYQWIELGIVVAMIAVGTTVAGADRASRRRRIRENEAAAIATLRLIAQAQDQFKALRAVDVDRDGTGEFGTFRELAGTVAVRTFYDGGNAGGVVVAPPLIPTELGRLNRLAAARMDGYRFKLFLPGTVGEAVEETPSYSEYDTLDGWVDTDELAESYWCCYASPNRPGISGRRTFFINQDGVVTETDGLRFLRREGVVDEFITGSAFVGGSGGGAGSITGTMALGTVGRLGEYWKVVE